MKGLSLQKQFNTLSEKYPGKKLDIELQPYNSYWNSYEAIYRTVITSHWKLVIDDSIKTCEQKCKKCDKKCGLWDIDGHYFVKCAEITKIDFDLQ